MDDEDVIGRLKELLGSAGFARLERFNEQLRKNPPTKEQFAGFMQMVREENRRLGVTDDDIARIKMELFG